MLTQAWWILASVADAGPLFGSAHHYMLSRVRRMAGQACRLESSVLY